MSYSLHYFVLHFRSLICCITLWARLESSSVPTRRRPRSRRKIRRKRRRRRHQLEVGVNSLRLRQNGCHFAGDIFRCIFLNANVWISIKFSLKFVPKVRINNIPALVQIMAWRRPGDKALSESMMVSLLTQICITRPQWVNFVHTEFIWGNIKNLFAISIISDFWDGADSWNLSSWKTRTCLFCKVNIMAPDDLVMQGSNSLNVWKRKFSETRRAASKISSHGDGSL